ncbi:MAG: hypothetical protein ISS93_03345 [Candidatus Aenigmarchaeota archaeon]|nr:hypothetical protein [Candidatus Aenigmarchaeota archaeon]
MKKGQMFVITMVFLVGLIFTVQGSLSQYSSLDLGNAFENDHSLLVGIKNSFGEVFASSSDCQELENNIQELNEFLNGRVVKGTVIDISTSFRCPDELNVTVHLQSINMDTRELVTFSSDADLSVDEGEAEPEPQPPSDIEVV